LDFGHGLKIVIDHEQEHEHDYDSLFPGGRTIARTYGWA